MIFVFSHHGERAAHVCAILYGLGWDNVCVMLGSIDQFSQTVDPTIPIYHESEGINSMEDDLEFDSDDEDDPIPVLT
eukprot:TRINITY_DN11099_c0_g1_i1.p1 TRINITY_DN11099_c0_g1~~TRINITY_DN11099_c0_g1_i1.p1  ORF type:complete len:77 (+),score=20.17 TRINITY_DN11099_c0_g1_i1:119-349(+)